jgi:hypothetical protein
MSEEVTLKRLDDRIQWYDQSARRKQYLYKGLKVVSIVSAGAIPVVTAASLDTLVAAFLGAFVVAIEGLQQLYKFHDQWLAHRYTCEALKREKYLYLAPAGAYAKSDHPAQLLAEQVEALVARETASWHDLELAAGAGKATGSA